MNGFELPLFPSGALDSAVITTVWVGVCVVALLNLRFGTTMAGLVVPGYLVPLLIVKPASAVITVVEAFVTYFLARVIAEWAMRRMGAAEMFGRDRFFALLLISVFVRVLGDGWVLPGVGEWLASKGLAFDYQSSLNSFGLIIVALIANQMWNGGPIRGSLAFALYVGITLLIVRFVLMPFTNFSLGGFAFMYEDVATNILASPKSYIILLTTAFVASRLNVNFGWEFGGIVIPALLAMQWYQPMKLFGTFLEAFIILGIGRFALGLPIFAKMNMEGARLLLLFFNVGFLYKAVLGLLLLIFAPKLKVSDYYAFGYLLSTLVAVKMHQKKYLLHMTSTTLKTSLGAVCIATVVGFGLAQMGGAAFSESLSATQKAPASRIVGTDYRDVAAAIIAVKAELYRSEDAAAVTPSRLEIDSFRQALGLLREDLGLRNRAALDAAFATVGYVLTPLPQGHLLLVDTLPQRGFGMYVINRYSRSPLVLEVPAPLDEAAVLEAAAHIFQGEGYLGLAIAGRRLAREDRQAANVLAATNSFMLEFQRAFGGAGVTQIRAAASTDEHLAKLYIKRELPETLSITALRKLFGNITLSWAESPVKTNRLREAMESHFAELYLGNEQLRIAIAAGQTGANGLVERNDVFLAQPLQRTLRTLYAKIPEEGSEAYVKPDLSDLLFLDQEVVRPLLRLAVRAARLTQRDYEKELVALADVASVKGYSVWQQTDTNHQARYLFLADQGLQGRTRGWSALVLRVDPVNDVILEVPHPTAEFGSFEYAVALFARSGARALLFAGAHPSANADGSADVIKLANSRSFFQLLHERLLASAARNAQVLQVRAAAPRVSEGIPGIVLAYEEGGPTQNVVATREGLLALLKQDGASVAIADGSRALAEFKPSRNAQSLIARIEPHASFATLWLSRATREAYAFASLPQSALKGLQVLGVPTQRRSLEQWQAACPGSAMVSAQQCSNLRNMVARFVTTRDIGSIQSLIAADPQLSVTHIQDSMSGQDFLAACRPGDGAAFIASLNVGRGDTLSAAVIDHTALRALRESRLRLTTATPACSGG